MIVLVIILIQVLYLKFVIKENPINFFGYSFLIVTTGSMEPEINSGELIIIKKKDKYENKDIVTYVDKDGFLVTHRIIEIDDFNMITKGDGNDLKDEEIYLALIGTFDENGICVFGKDGSKVIINPEEFAGYDFNNNKVFWMNGDEFHMKKSIV